MNKPSIALLNPYDQKGGASMGTYRLYKYINKYTSLRARLLVICAEDTHDSGISRAPLVLRFLFLFQAALNRLACRFLASHTLPVSFTFFTPLSLPALYLFLKVSAYSKLYLHSMSSGFTCPISFFLLIRRASIIKAADDWYLTGGCHYSMDCQQWQTGCTNCPHMNALGRLVVRANWLVKQLVFSSFKGYLVTPSNWLGSHYQLTPNRKCLTIYNSSSQNTISSPSPNSPTTRSRRLALGIPVTYLRDQRKGFLTALPVIVSLLEAYPIRIILCGGDANEYRQLITKSAPKIHHGAEVQSLGTLRRDGMAKFYSGIDFLLHFALYDNSPNVVTESLAESTPVIVLDRAGSAEHIKNSGAGVVIQSISELHTVVPAILREPHLIEQYSNSATTYSQSVLSSSFMANAYADLFARTPS